MISKSHFRIKKNGNPYFDCFCRNPELIENYDKAIADTTQIWECHHRLETHFSDGTERPRNAQLTQAELIALDMYYDRPPEELIFLTEKMHHIITHYGVKRSNITRSKISEANKGKCRPAETRKKISEAKKEKPTKYWEGKTFSEEHKRKISESRKGRVTWNKGKPLSEEHKRRISETKKSRHYYSRGNKGMHWYTNGVVNKLCFTCPDGFAPGLAR